jgi:hypothetical protein
MIGISSQTGSDWPTTGNYSSARCPSASHRRLLCACLWHTQLPFRPSTLFP